MILIYYLVVFALTISSLVATILLVRERKGNILQQILTASLALLIYSLLLLMMTVMAQNMKDNTAIKNKTFKSFYNENN